MHCPHCSALTPDNARYCPQCGMLLEQVSPDRPQSLSRVSSMKTFALTLLASLGITAVLTLGFHLPIFFLGAVLPLFWLGRKH